METLFEMLVLVFVMLSVKAVGRWFTVARSVSWGTGAQRLQVQVQQAQRMQQQAACSNIRTGAIAWKDTQPGNLSWVTSLLHSSKVCAWHLLVSAHQDIGCCYFFLFFFFFSLSLLNELPLCVCVCVCVCVCECCVVCVHACRRVSVCLSVYMVYFTYNTCSCTIRLSVKCTN